MMTIAWKDGAPRLLLSNHYVLNEAYHITYIRKHSGLYIVPEWGLGTVRNGDFRRCVKIHRLTKCPEVEGLIPDEYNYNEFMNLVKPKDEELLLSFTLGRGETLPLLPTFDRANEILGRYYKGETSAEEVCHFWFRVFNTTGLYPEGFRMPHHPAIERQARLYNVSLSDVVPLLKKLADTSKRMLEDGYVFINDEFIQLEGEDQ